MEPWIRMVCVIISSCLMAAGSTADEADSPRFDEILLTEQFHAESIHASDLDHDGHIDIVYGRQWYAGPDFTQVYPFDEVVAYEPSGYSRAFQTFVNDIDEDGWDDILVVTWPGEPAVWYRNPGDPRQTARWQAHTAFDIVENESPTWGDLDGDGRNELIFHTGNRFGYAGPDRDRPTQSWIFHPISEAIAEGRYTHGMGIGDVNGDGRLDVLWKRGWMEQPESLNGDPIWAYHDYPFAPNQGGSHMYVDDLDRDGDPDVITCLEAHAYDLVWYERLDETRDGEPAFRAHKIVGRTPDDSITGLVFTQMHAIQYVDIDGDGVRDLVTGKRWWAHGGKDPGGDEPAVLYWFQTRVEGPGQVDFQAHQIDVDSGVGTDFLVLDVNGDARLDILVGSKKGARVFLQR